MELLQLTLELQHQLNVARLSLPPAHTGSLSSDSPPAPDAAQPPASAAGRALNTDPPLHRGVPPLRGANLESLRGCLTDTVASPPPLPLSESGTARPESSSSTLSCPWSACPHTGGLPGVNVILESAVREHSARSSLLAALVAAPAVVRAVPAAAGVCAGGGEGLQQLHEGARVTISREELFSETLDGLTQPVVVTLASVEQGCTGGGLCHRTRVLDL